MQTPSFNNVTVQQMHCDFSRGTNKAPKILKNIGEVANHFPVSEPLCCVGSGDGLELDVFKLLGFTDIFGLEIDPIKNSIAVSLGCKSICSSIEKFIFPQHVNFYCSHVFEHLPSIPKACSIISLHCLTTACIIVPIERYPSKNPAHLSPINSLLQISIPNFLPVRIYENFNYEHQGILVFKRF